MIGKREEKQTQVTINVNKAKKKELKTDEWKA